MFFELRQYVIRPGQQKAWVKCMEEEIIPFQVKMGMVILGSFVGEEDESVYVWIRRFENAADRERILDAVHQHPRCAAVVETFSTLVGRTESTVRLEPTASSELR